MMSSQGAALNLKNIQCCFKKIKYVYILLTVLLCFEPLNDKTVEPCFLGIIVHAIHATTNGPVSVVKVMLSPDQWQIVFVHLTGIVSYGYRGYNNLDGGRPSNHSLISFCVFRVQITLVVQES